MLAVRGRIRIRIKHGFGFGEAVLHVRAGLQIARVASRDGPLERIDVAGVQLREILFHMAVALERHDAHLHLVGACRFGDEFVKRRFGVVDGVVSAA